MRSCFHQGCDTFETSVGDGEKGDKNFAFLKLTTQGILSQNLSNFFIFFGNLESEFTLTLSISARLN